MPEQIAAAEQAIRVLTEQRKRRTPAQQEHYALVARRSEAIQTIGPRPVDGVTFGKAKKGEK